MQGKLIKPDPFKRMEGSDVTLEWLDNDPTALTEPILIEKPDGLGMKMPEELTVADVAEIVGEDTAVEVIGSVLAFSCCGNPLNTSCRCGLAVKFTRVDVRKMGGVL